MLKIVPSKFVSFKFLMRKLVVHNIDSEKEIKV